MILEELCDVFTRLGCTEAYVKEMAENDNSKNQVYFGPGFKATNIFPHGTINRSKTTYKAKLDFVWIQPNGQTSPAKFAQLILYPRYPEVRFSGFLRDCIDAPSDLMSKRKKGRLLFLAIAGSTIYGFVADSDSEIAKEFYAIIHKLPGISVFWQATQLLTKEKNARSKLLAELCRINSLQWINAKRLDTYGRTLPCKGTNCGGYTLEAEMGIRPNANMEPDFWGWEIKQYNVTKWDQLNSGRITLMTPEPSGGEYIEKGVFSFLDKYGYPDDKNHSRLNFSTPHYFGKQNSKTKLTLLISGYDAENKIITDIDGGLALVDKNFKVAAIWHFEKLLEHWKLKHFQAVYVPSMRRYEQSKYQYIYGSQVRLGVGTDFTLFLNALASKFVFYDPGIKAENIHDPSPKFHRRSQFRVSTGKLYSLYDDLETVDLAGE